MALNRELKKAIAKALLVRSNKQMLEKELRAIYFLGLEAALGETGGVVERIESAIGSPLSEISKGQTWDKVDLRCIVYFVLKKSYGVTQIGRMFNRNHATIIHNLERFENQYLYDREFREKANKLIKLIKK